jgi:hypothetical protein
VDDRVRQAGLLYERAVFSGDAGPLSEADRELDAAEADLAVARGRLAIAGACQARRILQQVSEARTELSGHHPDSPA